ncbi:hypothetical protein L5515_009529 [Caenorhabditis briggsae]|uniref:Uncharacterized protein n=1 Tax=Caenorhabditis briggsae TaxID=6238 RepID=A0AAE9F923_CAEBR|nr:hypothetical protein L5515_009529 [Caenorhabditis briggsae]
MYPKVVHFHTPDHPIYVVAYDWEIREWIGYRQLISLGTVIVEGSTFLFLLHFNIWWSTKRMTMSQNTLGMQRRFLKAVYMQIAIPATIMIVPQIIMILLGYLYLNTTEMNSIAYMLMAIHGASATLIMLYFHAPYRDFCGKLFCRNTKKVEVKHISTSGTEVFLFADNQNITTAKLTCEGFYRGKLSGLENEDEFNYVRERGLSFVTLENNRPRFSKYAAVGFWVNGFRKTTCQEKTYLKNKCNGTNEFNFDDPTLSENPTGYKWGIGQPSGKLAMGSDCIQYRFNISTNASELDDWKCGLAVSDGGTNAFVGYVCGKLPE